MVYDLCDTFFTPEMMVDYHRFNTEKRNVRMTPRKFVDIKSRKTSGMSEGVNRINRCAGTQHNGDTPGSIKYLCARPRGGFHVFFRVAL